MDPYIVPGYMNIIQILRTLMEDSLYQIIFVSDGNWGPTKPENENKVGSTKPVPKNSVLIGWLILPCFFYLWSGSSEGRNKNMKLPCIAIHEVYYIHIHQKLYIVYSYYIYNIYNIRTYIICTYLKLRSPIVLAYKRGVVGWSSVLLLS